MLCPVLVGRGAETRALTTALDRARERDGGMLFVVGDAGVGKSRLVREAAATAAARGCAVLSGRAADSAVPVPFRPVTEALMRAARAGLAPGAPDMADYRPVLGALVPEWRRPGDADADISAIVIGEALLRLLTVPGPPGALLVLEDLHWADPETLAIVDYLADNLAGTPVLCVATLRDSEPSPGLDMLRSVTARRAATVVEVPRLTRASVNQMAAACLGVDEVPPEVAALLAHSDGLPFAVEEILAAAASSGQLFRTPQGWRVEERMPPRVPASIASSVRNRLAALDPIAAGVIESAAVIGRQFDWALLPRMAEVSEHEAMDALRQARELQLIEPVDARGGVAAEPGSGTTFRFRHSLTRDAILSDLLPPHLARRSAAAAAAVEDAHPGLPGAWCELAAELHERAGQAGRAAALRLEAGRRALRQGALGTAAAALGDAAELLARASPAESALAAEVDEALVTTYSLAGDYTRLAPVADRLIARLRRAGADPARQALIRIQAARTRAEDDPIAAGAHLSAARLIADQLADPALGSRIDVVAARCALAIGDVDWAEELARKSLAAAEAAGAGQGAGRHGWADDVAFEALEVIGRRDRLRDTRAARAVLERALAIATGPDFAIRRLGVLRELGTIEMLGEGRGGRLEEARSLAIRAGARSTAVLIDLRLARLLALGTDLARALDAAARSRDEASALAMARSEAMAESARALILGILGEGEQADQAASRAELLAPGDPLILTLTTGDAQVTRSLVEDELARAAGQARAAVRHARKDQLTAELLTWGYWPLLTAASGQDARQAIAEARAAGAEVARLNRGFLGYARAVAEGRDGHRARAAALAADADRELRAFASRWLHLARRVAAPAALADGWGDPVAWLREAAEGFDACGHARLASACRGMLRRAGERVPRPGRGRARIPAQMRRLGVTSREMEVLRLVGQGYSNAEIAGRLYISPKTVETHVASLIAKTGQAGRRELVAHAARLPGTP